MSKMKYVITDKNEAKIGGGFHADLADGLIGKVIKAGHCEQSADGSFRVWGESIGYRITSKPEDARLLKDLIK